MYYPGHWTQLTEAERYCQSSTNGSSGTVEDSETEMEGCSKWEMVFLIGMFALVVGFGVMGGLLGWSDHESISKG